MARWVGSRSSWCGDLSFFGGFVRQCRAGARRRGHVRTERPCRRAAPPQLGSLNSTNRRPPAWCRRQFAAARDQTKRKQRATPSLWALGWLLPRLPRVRALFTPGQNSMVQYTALVFRRARTFGKSPRPHRHMESRSRPCSNATTAPAVVPYSTARSGFLPRPRRVFCPKGSDHSAPSDEPGV